MKLSEMNTLELSAALCELAPHVEAIVRDDEIFRAWMEHSRESKGMNGLQQLVCFATKAIPLLLKKHEQHTLSILAVFTGKPLAEMETQKGLQTIREAKQVLQDKDFMDFLKSST